MVAWFAVNGIGFAASGLPLAKNAAPLLCLAGFALAYYRCAPMERGPRTAYCRARSTCLVVGTRFCRSTLGGAGFPAPKALPAGRLKTGLVVIAGASVLFALSDTVFVHSNLKALGVAPGSPGAHGTAVTMRLMGVVLLCQVRNLGLSAP